MAGIRTITQATRRRLAGEDGVVLVLVAICLVVFLGAAALAVDLSSFYGAQKKAQAAADAAALAAAHDVGQDPNYGQATTDVQNYVARNDPGAGTPSISYPSAHHIKVTVNATVPTFFARIWGQTAENVSASAVAGANNAAPSVAIFANDTSCSGGITFTGNNSITVDGSIHSNGAITFTGAAIQTIDGTASYGGPNTCPTPSTTSATIAGGTWRDPNVEPWPKDYTSVASMCTATPQNPHVITGSDFSWSGNGSQTVVTGIYCATNSISFSGSGTYTGTATFIAPSITISGNVSFQVKPDSADLPAGLNDLILYQTGSGTLQLQGSDLNSDTVFAPLATVTVQGNANQTVTGFVEAKDVQLAGGSGFTIQGTGPAVAGDSGATLTG